MGAPVEFHGYQYAALGWAWGISFCNHLKPNQDKRKLQESNGWFHLFMKMLVSAKTLTETESEFCGHWLVWMGWICWPQPTKGCFWRRMISSMCYPSHVPVTICSPHWRIEKHPGMCRHPYFKWLLVSWEGNIILFGIFFAVRTLQKDMETPVQQKLPWLGDSFSTCHAFQWLSCRTGFVQTFSLMACFFSVAWTLKMLDLCFMSVLQRWNSLLLYIHPIVFWLCFCSAV